MRTNRVIVRALACLAVLPVGLGPSMIAFAQTGTSTDPATTETAAPATTEAVAPTTAPTTTTTTTAAPPTTIEAPPSTGAPTATSPSVESAVTTEGATTGGPPATIGDPSTATTVDPAPTSAPTAPTSDAPVPPSTVVPDPTAGSAATVPDTTVLDSTVPDGTVVDPTTTVPDASTTEPGPSVLNAVAPPPTVTTWTLGLQYVGGTTYTGPYRLNLRNFIGGTTVSLGDGEVSGPLSRGLGVDYAVRVEMGSSYDPAFPFRWECTGSDSGLQTATTEQFTPAVSDLDATMDCVFIIDNTNPPTIDVVTEVQGDTSGVVSFDYDVRYNFFGDWPIGSHVGTNGSTVRYEGLAGFRVEITPTPTGSTPPDVETVIECRDASGGFVTSSTTKVSLSPSRTAPRSRARRRTRSRRP